MSAGGGRGRLAPYLVGLPGGLWLAIFFVVPLLVMFSLSLQSGNAEAGFTFTWEWSNYTRAWELYSTQFLRSAGYAVVVTALCLVLAYPMAYWIAFYGGARKSTYLFLVLLPFFVSFVIRTASWKFILNDQGFVLGPLKEAGLLPEDFHLLATTTAVIGGLTYNYLPFMVLPLYVALERVDPSLVEAAHDLFAGRAAAFRQGGVPALAARGVRRRADHLRARGLRLRQLQHPRRHQHDHDRQRHPDRVPQQQQLPARLGHVVPAHGGPAGRDLHLRQGARHRAGDGGGPAVSTVATRQAPPEVAPAPAVPGRRRRWTRLILPVYTWLMIFYFSLPILVMIVFGFNDTTGRLNLRWQGFTLRWYQDVFAIPALTTALRNSLIIAVISTIISTVLGTTVGLALGRYRFRGKGVYDLVIFSAISAPELVLGASLLSLFVTTQFVRGFVTITIAHVAFSLAFVAVTVRARVLGLDPALEEAAQDLGADPWTTFRKITLPLLAPGIVAGALLAFALSIDDFVVTSFVSGQTETFPLWVYGATRVGVPPQVNVMGTLIFLGGVAIAVGNAVLARRQRA